MNYSFGMSHALFPPETDEELDRVEEGLRGIPDVNVKLLDGIARAVDEVIDPVRSGRWTLKDLDQPEKTVIGIRVENIIRMDLQLERSEILDIKVAGVDVDVKFTIKSSWTIPPEAINQICLVTRFNEIDRTVSAGLIRTTPLVLNKGLNRDSKTSVSASGKSMIRWLFKDLPPHSSIINFMATLGEDTRTAITDSTVGAQTRQNRLFTHVQATPIPEQLVEAISQHKDWTRRLRPDASNKSAPGKSSGYDVLRQSSAADRAQLQRLGLPPLLPGFCMSIPVGP